MRSFFAHISLAVLLNLLVKPAWLLVEMEVQDRVGHEDWGLYSALLSFGFLFVALADLGLNPYSTRSLAAQPGEIGSAFPRLLGIKLLLVLAFPALVLVLGWLLGYDPRALYFLFLLCLVHGGTQLIELFRATFRAAQRFRLDAWLSVIDRLLLLALAMGLFGIGVDVERFIYARLLAAAAGILLCYALLGRLYGWLRPRFGMAGLGAILRQSLPFAFMTILYSIHDKVDQVMLERLAGDYANGLYAGAYRWLDAFSMYLWTILPFFFARFARHHDEPAVQERLLHSGQVLSALPLIFVSVFVFFFGEKLLFLFDRSAPQDLAVMRACLHALFATALLNGLFAIFSTLLTSTGHERPVNRMILASIALNVLLNALFIPRYGAVAAAWTTLASYACLDLAYVAYTHRVLPLRVPWRQTALLLLAAAITALTFYLADLAALPWYLTSLLGGTVLAGTAYLLGLVGPALFRQLRS
ncbi:MAG: hypothetical protein OHK0039_37770 [Bacteroidia bacterium]